jgi:hypothetical protein
MIRFLPKRFVETEASVVLNEKSTNTLYKQLLY